MKLIIDASAFFFPAYFAIPARIQAANGEAVHGAYGLILALLRMMNDLSPDYIALCFDESLGTGFRHRLYPEYKANRPLPDENIRYQFNLVKKFAELLGFSTFASRRYEADDLIASVAHQLDLISQSYLILGNDKDLYQILKGSVEGVESYCNGIWFYPKKKLFGMREFERQYQFSPSFWPDYLALVGDSSDYIPGVPSIGEKTANRLITKYHCLESIQEAILNGALPLTVKQQQNLQQYFSQALHMRKVITLSRTAIRNFKLERIYWQKEKGIRNKAKIRRLLEKNRMKHLQSKVIHALS